VIGSSLNRLRWNRSDEGLKLIYIAGNEPFNQGPERLARQAEQDMNAARLSAPIAAERAVA